MSNVSANIDYFCVLFAGSFIILKNIIPTWGPTDPVKTPSPCMI